VQACLPGLPGCRLTNTGKEGRNSRLGEEIIMELVLEGNVFSGEESVFVLNSIERRLAEEIMRKFEAGLIVPSKDTRAHNSIRSRVCYQYRPAKNGQLLYGVMMDCPFKLRYRGSNRVFFSAWNCTDVCGLFYDVVFLIYVMAGLQDDMRVIDRMHDDFEVDLNVDSYVFYTGEIAGMYAELADKLSPFPGKIANGSQYTMSLYDEQNFGVYEDLIKKIKDDGYSSVRVLQLWVRGEILYYAIADGTMLRPEKQRKLSPREEEDLIRKIYKTLRAKNKIDPADFGKV
jgi:hypothetical protein